MCYRLQFTECHFVRLQLKARSAPYLDLHLEIDSKGRLKTKLYDKRDFPIVNFPFTNVYVATFQLRVHMEFISLSWSDIPEIVVPIRISLRKGCC